MSLCKTNSQFIPAFIVYILIFCYIDPHFKTYVFIARVPSSTLKYPQYPVAAWMKKTPQARCAKMLTKIVFENENLAIFAGNLKNYHDPPPSPFIARVDNP